MLRFSKILSATELPDQWDEVADTYFQRRRFLIHTDSHNPCYQRYYLSRKGNDIVAGACVYSLLLDLFTYSRLRLPVRFSIIGIPASISDPGLLGNRNYWPELLSHIFRNEKGILLCLNIPQDFHVKPALNMRTLPNIILEHNFPDWKTYLLSLRSKYRRRLKIIKSGFNEVRIDRLPCSDLTPEMYGLYEQIMANTKTKLEVLSFEYLSNLPEGFILNTYTIDRKVVCWNICLETDERMVFFFGGLDYSMNRSYKSYFNSLIDIIRNGINRNFKVIEFGQTAEIPKLKCGGKLIEKNMLLYHANPLLRMLFSVMKPLLQYKYEPPDFQVFRDDLT